MNELNPPPSWTDHRDFKCSCTWSPVLVGLDLVLWDKRCRVHTGYPDAGQLAPATIP